MAYDGTPPPPAFASYTPGVGVTLECGCAACVKAAQVWLNTHGDSLLANNFIQHITGGSSINLNQLAAAPTLPQILLTAALTDTETGDNATTGTLTVGGAHVVSTINTIGDVDAFKVHLEAGKIYDISMIQKIGGPTGVFLQDSFITLTDLAGNVIATADGGSPDTLTSTQGLDAKLTISVTATGDYLVKAQAFDQDGTNGTTGDGVGDYELFAVESTGDPTAYHAFYKADTPMASIDWGTQIDRTSRNPDGDNGTRTDNGVPNGGGPITTNNYGIVGKNVVTYYLAKAGDVFVDENPATPGTTDSMVARGMQDWEKQAFRNALHEYEKVADVVYLEVQNREEADFKFITYNGTPGAGASLLGRMSPPNTENEGQGEFNAGDVRWTEAGLQQGGFYFPTLLHEIGHGHGMAHPHDNGGHSTVMPGADGGTGGLGGGYGDFGLSQQVYTIMSYNDGWAETGGPGGAPAGQGGPSSGGLTGVGADGFGWMGTLGALDIAVIQDKYGVNQNYAKGNDTYVIKDVNQAGSYYSTIWDGGGDDTIMYSGARNANIDLRAATLKYEDGGAGRVSYALGAWSGFTIANGVTIEKAYGGSGNDTLTGNAAANTLVGGAGSDTMTGLAGDDIYEVTETGDLVVEAAAQGVDTVVSFLAAYGLTANVENLALAGSATTGIGNGLDNGLFGNAGANTLIGGAGNDLMIGGAGDDVYEVTEAGDMVRENAGEGVDTVVAYVDAYTLAANVENLVLGGSTVSGMGNAGDNGVFGNAADNNLSGGGGADLMIGGLGNDVYEVTEAGDVVRENAGEGTDTVVTYVNGSVLAANVENMVLAGAVTSGTGNAGANGIIGNALNNTINGGSGNDTLIGGAGADTFVWTGVTAGQDTIMDFTVGSDKVTLSSSMFGNFAAVQAKMVQLGSDVVIVYDAGTTLALKNTTVGQLTAASFVFSASDDDHPQVLPATPEPEAAGSLSAAYVDQADAFGLSPDLFVHAGGLSSAARPFDWVLA